MELMLPIEVKKISPSITYRDKIMLTGSCFTEHIGNALADLKFSVLQNPNGILFGPDAVCKSLRSYAGNKKYSGEDLFQINDVWYSWDHHSRYAGTDITTALSVINASQSKAHDFLKAADWLIITFGSAFSYRITDKASPGGLTKGDGVANCHRAPAAWFEKTMLDTATIESMILETIAVIRDCNPDLKIIFTISPVRHIRDGVIENNRSKARLIEAVHNVINSTTNSFYFPAYELVIDVLRDYRFYDIDLVHPNYSATNFVLEKFSEAGFEDQARQLMPEMKKLVIARRHKPLQPNTKAHQQFLAEQFSKAKLLQEKYPFLDLKEELVYFSKHDA